MTANGKIPFLDLIAPHLEMEEELLSVYRTALRTAAFIGGPMLEDFERDYAHYCDTRCCVGVSSGTDALRFALMAAGIRQDDLVITVPNTFIATVEAITQAGAQPRFVDVDEHTYNLDPEKLKEYVETQCDTDAKSGKLIDRKTRRFVSAIVPVHLYGQPAEMDPILKLSEQYGLTVIEDACQAHGAEYFSQRQNHWMKAGSLGRAAAFSFYPGKNLGACGEAGAVTTNDPELAQKVRMLRDHGQAQKYYHDMEGYNGRLDAIQAGILRAKLRHLTQWNEKRRDLAYSYNQMLAHVRSIVKVPFEPSWAKAVYHLYVIRVHERDQLQAYLAARQVGTGIHYPIPLHLQKAYEGLGYHKGDFPRAERAASEILSLPMYSQLRLDQQDMVAQNVSDFFSLATPSKLPYALTR